MSKLWTTGLALLAVAAIVVSYQLGLHHSTEKKSTTAARHALYYVDPMHPSYKSDRPGIAPDCGMKLEPVYAEDLGTTSRAIPGNLQPGAVGIDGASQQLLGIRVATVEKGGGTRVVRVVGRVVPEDTRIYRVNSGVDGFMRETYQDSVGVRVKKNQKLASYFSPEFLSVASGFLAATERVPGSTNGDGARTVPFPGALAKQGTSSLQGYADRLRNLGMSDVQIQHISESRQLPENVDVVSPIDGFILSRSITPGQHFDHNMEFYRIVDLQRVWVVAEVSEQEAVYLRAGGKAQITLSKERHPLNARIADSLPESEAGGGTVKLRLEVENPKFELRPEMLVDVQLPVTLPPAVTVPIDALVDSGTRARVYVEASEGIFEPRQVETGWRQADRVEILRGVKPGERVVVAATFLVDSESRLKSPAEEPTRKPDTDRAAATSVHVANIKMVRDPNCGMSIAAEKSAAAGLTMDYNGKMYFFCSDKCKNAFKSNTIGAANPRQGD